METLTLWSVRFDGVRNTNSNKTENVVMELAMEIKCEIPIKPEFLKWWIQVLVFLSTVPAVSADY